MKVIREGKKMNGIMRVTCKTCKAELEIMTRDLKKESGTRRYDPGHYSYKCPCCKRKNYLAYRDLSEEIRFDLADD